jgi:hypothetical protein
MNIHDARTELDGLLRQTITHFREACADRLWTKNGKGPATNAWKVRGQLQSKLEVMFEHEEQLRANLWAAVEETVEERKKA